MKKIFEDRRYEIVGQFASILEAEGIEAFVKNEVTSTLDGVAPGDIIHPELWVLDDERYDEALQVLKPHYEALRSPSQ